MQHMVKALVLPCALKGSHIARRFHHADGASVAPFVLTDGAHLIFCEILAHLAAVYLGVRLLYGACKAQSVLLSMLNT